jgi:hypothetical protein
MGCIIYFAFGQNFALKKLCFLRIIATLATNKNSSEKHWLTGDNANKENCDYGNNNKK